MAEQIAIPAGINPAQVGGSGPDSTHYGTKNNGSGAPDAGLPPIPPSGEQRPGTVEPPKAPAGADAAEFAAFQAWKASQGKPAAPTPPAAPTGKPAVTASGISGLGGDSLGGDGALSAVKAAAQHDPVINTTFEMFGLVAPDADLTRALGNAIDRGDPALIDRAYLREVGGDKADRLIKLAEGMVNHVNAQVDSMVEGIHTSAGGEAGWNAATAAFNQSAPAYLKSYVKEALDSANPAKIKQGAQAVLDFVKSSGQLPNAPKGHVQGGGGEPTASIGLSKAQYQAERAKLNRFDRGYEQAARDLDSRRALGKKAGL